MDKNCQIYNRMGMIECLAMICKNDHGTRLKAGFLLFLPDNIV